MDVISQKRILFLSTHNLATNPRLVKEIRLAVENNFLVEVVCFEFDNWSRDHNEKLKEELLSVKFITISAGRKHFLPWFFSVVNEQISRKFISLFKSERLLADAVSRRSRLIIKKLDKVSKPDWVIGHNPGALYPTEFAAQKFNCKAGFDVEDYHPGEGNDEHLQRLTKQLMKQVLPKMDYVSFAAPLILEQVKKDIGGNHTNWFTVLNYFPSEEFILPGTQLTGPLKLVWFSQNISFGRGLELVLPSVKSNAEKLELHLYGNMNQDFKKQYLEGINNIFFHGAVSQKQLHRELSQYDVGLALDIPVDKNREIVITNKLLSYLQAGLYVMATDTKGQSAFIKSFPGAGSLFDYRQNNSNDILEAIFNNIDSIRNNRNERFEKHKKNNWETESFKLMSALDSH